MEQIAIIPFFAEEPKISVQMGRGWQVLQLGALYWVDTLISISHLLLDLVRHIDQPKAVEHSVNVGHAPDVTQCLWSVHDRTDCSDVLVSQQDRTPRKALAALSPVDP